MSETDDELECPNDVCGYPIDASLLEGVDSFRCPNCAMTIEFAGDDEDDEEEAEGSEFNDATEIETDGTDEIETIENETDVTDETDETDDDIVDTQEDMSEEHKKIIKDFGAEPEPKNAKRKKKKKKKKKKDMVDHKKSTTEYLDFFLDHPEGVTIDMLQVAFSINMQSAHYAQRVTFVNAEKLDYETSKESIKGTNQKIFFIRGNV